MPYIQWQDRHEIMAMNTEDTLESLVCTKSEIQSSIGWHSFLISTQGLEIILHGPWHLPCLGLLIHPSFLMKVNTCFMKGT